MTRGPAVRTGTTWHRWEHAVLATALAGLLALLVFRWHATDGWRVLFWLVAPDLVFLPIAVATRNGQWPPWGAVLYNATHTYLLMVPTFLLASFLQGHVVWPLLAWALHVEADRALGFDLREWRKKETG